MVNFNYMRKIWIKQQFWQAYKFIDWNMAKKAKED